jgi:hypothetical protein
VRYTVKIGESSAVAQVFKLQILFSLRSRLFSANRNRQGVSGSEGAVFE